MTLQVHTEENDQREVTMTVEVSEGRIEKAMRQKARELAREINVPGFRPGKAPYHVVLRRIGKDSLRYEVIDDLVPDLFEEALEQADLTQEDLYTRPNLDNMSEEEPLVLTFILSLQPVVTLGDYRALRREIEPIEISEEAVDEALERIQSRLAELEEVERPAEVGDLVTIKGVGRLAPLPTADETEDAEAEDSEPKDDIIFDEERINVLLDSEKTFPGTPFVDNILGLSTGEEANFIFTFPETYDEEELAGREANIELSVLKVQNRTLPALDDDLAQKEGADTLEALREGVKQELQTKAEEAAQNELLEYMVTELRKDAVLVYPPSAITEEVDGMIEDSKQQAKRNSWEWEDFLLFHGETEESMRESMQQVAVDRVETRILFMELLKLEHIAVSPEDIDAALEAQLSKYEDERLRAGMKEYFLKGDGISNLAAEIINGKLYERIKMILTGNAPDLSDLKPIPLEDEEE